MILHSQGQKAQYLTDTLVSEHPATIPKSDTRIQSPSLIRAEQHTNPVVLPGLSDTQIPEPKSQSIAATIPNSVVPLASNPIVTVSAAPLNKMNYSTKVSATTIPTLDPHQAINDASSSSYIQSETQYGNTFTVVVPGCPKDSASSTHICIQAPIDSNISTVDFSSNSRADPFTS